MKKILTITAITAALLTGCITKQPGNTPESPPVYSVSPDLTNSVAVARGVNTALSPLNPHSGITDYAVESVGGLLLAISAYIAKRKNDEANRQKQAADSLAETIVAAGIQSKALQTAGHNGVIESVATHIDNNTPVVTGPS